MKTLQNYIMLSFQLTFYKNLPTKLQHCDLRVHTLFTGCWTVMFMEAWSIVFLLFLMVALNSSLSFPFCFSTPGVYEYRHSK